jgi:hypothetical protein
VIRRQRSRLVRSRKSQLLVGVDREGEASGATPRSSCRVAGSQLLAIRI